MHVLIEAALNYNGPKLDVISPSNLIVQARKNLSEKVEKILKEELGHLPEHIIARDLIRVVRDKGMQEDYYFQGKLIIAANYNIPKEF